MADDFQVKQSSSSSGAYGLTGSVIGAAAGGAGAHYLTKPKYASHNDIINEAKDSADFKSKLEKADGEEKKFLQAAKDVADEKSNAEKTWNDEFKAFQETHKEGFKETDEYKKLVDTQNAAEKALNDKKAELEKVEIPAKEGTVDAKTQRGLDTLKDKIAEQKKQIEVANKKSETYSQKLNDKINEKINRLVELAQKKNDKEYNKLLAEIANDYRTEAEKNMTFPKGTKINSLVDELLESVKDTVNTRLEAIDKGAYDVIKLDEIAKKKQQAIDEFKSLTKGKKAGLDGKAFEGVDLSNKSVAEIDSLIAKQNKQLDLCNEFEKLLEESIKESKESGGKTSVVEKFKLKIGKLSIPLAFERTSATSPKTVKFADKLEKEQRQWLERLTGDVNANEKTIKKALQKRKAKVSKMQKALTDVRKVETQIAQLGGNGAHIQEITEGGTKKLAIVNAEGKVVDIKPKDIKVTVSVPKSAEVVKLENGLSSFEQQLATLEEKAGTTPARKLTEAEIKEKLAAETNAYNEAKAAVEKAQKGLEKVELKPEEQLAEFAKSKGVKDKEEFINNSVKEKTEKFAKDWEAQFKRKFGFAEHASWKIAGAAAAGAVVLGAIFNAFAPSKKS